MEVDERMVAGASEQQEHRKPGLRAGIRRAAEKCPSQEAQTRQPVMWRAAEWHLRREAKEV